MASKYEKCKIKMVDKIMKKFESGTLKSSSKKKVQSKLQALAIGYSIAESECKKHIDDVYLKRLKTKVDKFLFSEKKKIKKGLVGRPILRSHHYRRTKRH